MFALLLSLVSCEYKSYETGDGEYSNLHADFVDITVGKGQVTSIVTDDDVSLPVPLSLSYAENKDTVVRSLLYYNMGGEGKSIEIIGRRSVSVIVPVMKDKAMMDSSDPLKLNAVWLSANRRWLNMTIGIKCGSSEDTVSHSLLLRCDSISNVGDGAMWLTLLHDQGDMPQYYTQEYNISVPLLDKPDTIYLSVNTYSGEVKRQMIK